MKLTSTARVRVTVDVHCGCSYGEDWTAESIHKDAVRIAEIKLARALSSEGIERVGDSAVASILTKAEPR